MKHLVVASLGIVAMLLAMGSVHAQGKKPSKSQLARRIARGRYLVNVAGCEDCHTAHDKTGQPVNGMSFGGHPAGAPLASWDPSMLEKGILFTGSPTLTSFAGPWGVSVAPNISSDKILGIGNMKASTFLKAWREQKLGGRPILPPMPAPAFKNFTDEDILSIHAYLMTTKPIHNEAPPSILAGAPPKQP